MFPVSGALQLNTSGAMNDRPVSSAICAYSTLDRPGPYLGSGMKRFHNPSLRALAFSSSMTLGAFSSSASTIPWYATSRGSISVAMKAATRSAYSWALGDGLKSMTYVNRRSDPGEGVDAADLVVGEGEAVHVEVGFQT